MANRLFSPDEQYSDQNGLPYAGGFLYFYASGTSTPLATYTDQALTIPNTNPVVLDSAGRAGTIFLQNLAYKVILKDVNGNTIWTEDPVFSSDFSTVAQFQVHAGSPNGTVAGTAGSGTIPSSVVWDSTNNILYVCTQTGNSSTAVWTAVNSSTSAAVVPPPQGYLSPQSGGPVTTSDVSGSTIVCYAPLVGNITPIYNGSSFVPTVFTELTLTLTSSQAANTLYDVFMFNNAGVPTLAAGPAWSSSAGGTSTRGTGAGTTQLQSVGGTWVNAVSMTGRNNANTYTIAANQGTYLGTILIDGSAGQVTCNRSYGQSRKWAIHNAYNRLPVYLKVGDNTANWTTNATRPSNGNAANSFRIVTGLPFTDTLNTTFQQVLNPFQATTGQIGVGFNSNVAISGNAGVLRNDISDQTIEATVIGRYSTVPPLGVNTVTCMEVGGGGSGTKFFGTEASMLMVGTWTA